MNCSSGKLPFELCHAGLHAQPRQRRWYAAVVGNNALADFASAPAWAQAGMPDYVTRIDNTDQNEISTGCGMAFLSWLQKLGYSLRRIAPAMVSLGTPGVLAQLYSELTGDAASRAWPGFLAAVKALPSVRSDDPFGALGTPPRRLGGPTSARERKYRAAGSGRHPDVASSTMRVAASSRCSRPGRSTHGSTHCTQLGRLRPNVPGGLLWA